VKVYDEQGLQRAISDLQKPRPAKLRRTEAGLRRRRGLWLSLAALGWSGVLFGATYLWGSSIPRIYVIPMPFLMMGSLAYLFAAHCDGYTMTTWSGWMESRHRGISEMGKSLGRLPAWAVLLLLACVVSTVMVLAKTPSHPEGFAVQDKHGYWLEDSHGGKVRPMTEEEFRNFGVQSDRPLAIICLELSLVATIGFAFGPGSVRK
jgi:hypothetical protein